MVRLILVFHPEVRGRLRMQTLEQGPVAKEPLVSTLYARERETEHLPQLLAWEGWAPSTITVRNSKGSRETGSATA